MFFKPNSMKVKLSVASVLIIAAVAVSAAALSAAKINNGPQNLKIDGGKRGIVPFPHHRHQENVGDCKICHTVFPQKVGSIQDLKAQGKLKKKYVMNKLCTKCHKEKKKAGLKSGPTTCAKCHIKEKS